ncbi:type II toxin-antitoxin system RelE/ParE family toxin [Methylorubrum suomiense]|uniref:Toxin ParE4 n=1 Tax=Methylorubrum suomiense TaxID=144191 RepID=A0ABQ4V2U6_9HYPH|nr:type II toxin-antitoxin system RelE/ParE family toxin [Methylorubrum suomiense]GJE77642.1 Toxin ParE4 [Methylorubrum suomiense]
MTYRTTEAADRDIAGLYADGEAQFGTPQAERYQDGLFDLFDLLADNPRLARERPEFTPPVRIHPYGAHLVVYPSTTRAS